MEKKKTVLLGVSGGIAAYKSASLASMLIKDGYDAEVLMTKNAENFINPIVFETLTGHKCLVDTFDRNFEFKVEHVAVAKKADAVLIAPATANVIAKLAHGIADDMLTTTVLACRSCPKLIAPAMNTEMYLNPVVQDNLAILRKYGWQVIEPAEGHLACGDAGTENLIENSVKKLEKKNLDMIAANSLNTAGAGFQGDTNVVTLITHDSRVQLPLLSKEETAARIIDGIMECMGKKTGE